MDYLQQEFKAKGRVYCRGERLWLSDEWQLRVEQVSMGERAAQKLAAESIKSPRKDMAVHRADSGSGPWQRQSHCEKSIYCETIYSE